MHGTIRNGLIDFETESDEGAYCDPICSRADGGGCTFLPVAIAQDERIHALVGTVAERTGSVAADGDPGATTDGDDAGRRASQAAAPERTGDLR